MKRHFVMGMDLAVPGIKYAIDEKGQIIRFALLLLEAHSNINRIKVR